MNGQTISLEQLSARSVDLDKARIEGFKEAVKEMVKEKFKNQQKLNALVANSQSKPLLHLNTFFPFEFFPIHLVIESDRVNITYSDFFNSGQIVSLTMDIIQEVSVESGPIFSALRLTTNKPMEPFIRVKYLKKKEAMRARRLIQGLIAAKKNNVELENMDPDDILQKLEGLGITKEAEAPMV